MMQKNKNILSIILAFLVVSVNFIYADPPDWDPNGDGVIDNYPYYANSGSITARIYINDLETGDFGDMLGGFGPAYDCPTEVFDESTCILNGELEIRGVALASEVPDILGGGYSFNILIYSNETSGESIVFKFYDFSNDLIIDINETIEFVADMTIGDVIFPQIFNGSYETISGCIDDAACNYNSEANTDDGSCYFAEENYDCDGNCAAEVDCSGVCGGDNIPPEDYLCNEDGVLYPECMEECGYVYNIVDIEEFPTLGCEFLIPFINSNEACFDDCETDLMEHMLTMYYTCQSCLQANNCDDACFAELDECGVCDGDGIPDGDCDCDGNVDLGCGCFEAGPSGCDNACGSTLEFDECGDCDGDGIAEGECDCDGNMFDCLGECGGTGFLDNCNQCVGGSSGLLECENSILNIPVHVGANLISFNSLPIDNSIESILYPNNQDFIFSILGEINSTVNIGNNIWAGSLSNFSFEDGYWIRALNATNIFIEESYPIQENPIYYLHEGANLISYPFSTPTLFEDAISDTLLNNFTAILGESVSSVQLEDGTWTGSLSYFENNKAYWFIAESTFEFSYLPHENSQRQVIGFTDDLLYNQSSEQAFYYVQNFDDLDLNNGDMIVAFNNNVIVGSRVVNNQIPDIPVMGYDGSSYSLGYCLENDIPSFKIFKEDGEIVDLYGNVSSYENLGIFFMDLFLNDNNSYLQNISILNLYPNPFNPLINIDFEMSVNDIVKIEIYNLEGRFVEQLYNGYLNEGFHYYSWNAQQYNSGIYFVKISSLNQSIVKKITLIK